MTTTEALQFPSVYEKMAPVLGREEEMVAEELASLYERVTKLEDGYSKRHKPVRLVSGSELQEIRIDYTNLMRKQWEALKELLNTSQVMHKTVIVNVVVFHENALRLANRGLKCERIPFTYCTQITFTGYVSSCEYLEEVD